MQLSAYTEALLVVGYTPPVAKETAATSLASLGLDCQGELHKHLWQRFGWASPLPVDWADGENPALDILELEVQHLGVSTQLVQILRAGGLERLKASTGAFLSLDEVAASGDVQLRVVGNTDELQSVKEALAELMRQQGPKKQCS